MEKNYFIELNSINVNEHTEKKNNLTYLSWAWAWQEVKIKHPSATYTIYENSDGWNYFTDGRTAWVKTGVTINDIEHIEYLPVMDFKNKSIPLESITSFDVNKTIQRSLTKAVARHGLGLYIYAGEDLPEEDKTSQKEFAKNATQKKRATTIATNKAIKDGATELVKKPRTIEVLKNHYNQSVDALNKIKSIKEFSNSQIDFVNNLCVELFERGLEEEHAKLTELYNSKNNINDTINF